MSHKSEQKVLTAEALAECLKAELAGDGSIRIEGVSSLGQAGPAEVSFVTSDKHAAKLADSKAAAIIVGNRIEQAGVTQLIVADVNAALIAVLGLFAPKLTPTEGVHPAATVEQSASLGKNVSVGPGAYISHNAQLGDNSMIGAGCTIGENSTIGQNCRLDSNVVVYHNCKIGDNCIIQANCTIGGTGFGYSLIDGQHKLIPHNGGVIIEDCVEIGANSCVDRAKFGNTVIGAGTKIDSQVQIAHNVIMGKCCLLAAQVGIAGSAQLGDCVVCAGQTGVADNVKIGDGAVLGAGAGATGDIEPGTVVMGVPALDMKNYLRSFAEFKRLPKTTKQLKDVVRKVKSLEAAKNDKK